ncbi:transporter substrate-binding domain-containing protein, partial [Streptococcus pyogenes]|uniref:transporter substrate-binding domain-containing protein n=1 Tax=Streptococcus pyogenes TaxID=1314 RepID=UPI0016532C8C
MKKSVTLLSIGLASLLLAACAPHQSQKSIWYTIKEKGVFKVATPGTYHPTSFYNDNNELVGYEVDMVKEIRTRLPFL